MSAIDIETPRGVARAHLHPAEGAKAALVLGPGASGSIEGADLEAATEAAVGAGVSVALVEPPHRVAGKKSPSPPAQLDEAWLATIEHLGANELAGLDLITGGRSAGARVACRTAAATDPVAVLCLAFPVHPPGKPEKTRLDELDSVEVPVLVVQGESDPFGMPPEAAGRTLVKVKGNHSLKAGLDSIGPAVADWLAGLGQT
jgi:uncharacterized protein